MKKNYLKFKTTLKIETKKIRRCTQYDNYRSEK